MVYLVLGSKQTVLFVCFNSKSVDVKLLCGVVPCLVTRFRSCNFCVEKRWQFLFRGLLIFVLIAFTNLIYNWDLLAKLPCLFIVFSNSIYLVDNGFFPLSNFIYFMDLIFISFLFLITYVGI